MRAVRRLTKIKHIFACLRYISARIAANALRIIGGQLIHRNEQFQFLRLARLQQLCFCKRRQFPARIAEFALRFFQIEHNRPFTRRNPCVFHRNLKGKAVVKRRGIFKRYAEIRVTESKPKG